MFCNKCGREIPDESKFCRFCGNKIDRELFEQNEQQISNNKTVKVVFSRRKRMMGWAIPMRIFIDKNQVASLSNGASQEVEVTAGIHKVVFDTVGEVYEKEIDFSAEYSKIYVNLVMKMGLVTGMAAIESIVNEK